MSDYYTDSNVPSTGSALSSSVMRAEFDLISAAFVKVAPYTGNGGKAVCINAGGTAQEAVTCTGTGNVVRATSPTLTTPDIGTPSAGVLTNCTGLPVAGGGTGRATSTTAYGLIAAGTTATGAHQTLAAGATTEILVGGGASALPVWTTATGTGAPVRAGSPTFTGTVNAAALTATGTVTIPVALTGVLRADAGVVSVEEDIAPTTEFTTANVLSASNVQTMAHSLGAVPNTITYCLVVTTENNGWAVGDEIYKWIDGLTATADTTILVGADATNIVVASGATTAVTILNKTTAAAASSALGNFKLRVRVT